MPGVVTFTDGSTITYTYAADGTKLRTVHKTGGTTTTTDYCGTVIYENGKAKLLLTEAGYVTLSDNKYHYYLRDHQGNNRVVVDQSGAVKETNHYYPFGGLFASATSVQPYKYNGKELDTNKGLNWYDYGARHYDPALGRFHTNDRFAEKYPALSTYQYAANNPVGNIDVNGDSIVVLNYGKYQNQHMAMLIQNETGKWQYYSVNGNNVYISGKFSGGREFNDLAVGSFSSPLDFFESSYNSAGDKDDKSVNNYGFREGYIIPTTKEQDKLMRETFTDISNYEEYNLLENNCATTVQRSMEAAGLKTFDNLEYIYRVPANHSLGESGFTTTYKNTRPLFPSTLFRSIIKQKPQGCIIYRTKRQ